MTEAATESPPDDERPLAAHQEPERTSPGSIETVAPSGGRVYAVRWLREDGAVRQKLYRRRHGAQVFAAKIRAAGYQPEIYASRVDWQRVRR